MPVIQIDTGILTREKKAELIKKLTEAASSTLNIPPQAFTVIIRENSLDNVGNGGKPLSEIIK